MLETPFADEIPRLTADFRAHSRVLSDSVNDNLDSVRTDLENIDERRAVGEGRYRGRLLLHFVDPLHLLHTDLIPSIGDDEIAAVKKFVQGSRNIRRDIQKLIESSVVLERELAELEARFGDLDEVKVGNEVTINSKDMQLRNRRTLVILWESLTSGEAALRKEEYAENIELLQRVENYVMKNLAEVRKSRVHLDNADSHFRLMKEEYDEISWSDADKDTLERAIQRIRSSVRIMDEDAKGVDIPNRAGIGSHVL